MAMRQHTSIHGAARPSLVANAQSVAPYAAFKYGDETHEVCVFIEPEDLPQLQREMNDAVAVLRAVGAIREPGIQIADLRERGQ